MLKKLTFAQLKKIAYVYAQMTDDNTLVDFVGQHRGSAADRVFDLHPVDEPGFLGDVENITETIKGLEQSVKAQQKLLSRYRERNTPPSAIDPAAEAAKKIAGSIGELRISYDLGGTFGTKRPPNW